MIHNLDDTITLRLHGDSTVGVPAKTILADLLARAQASTAKPAEKQAFAALVPRVGEYWKDQGGIYAGIVRGEDGQPDHHLILCHTEAGEGMTWQAAMDWAKGVFADGHSDFALPSRREQSILYANTREHFEDAWYWSGTQYAGGSGSAWGQDFDNGLQGNIYKNYEGRARAVRRLIIQ